MDDISTRTVIIAVNIFITITIVTLVIVMFSQMGEIYGVVASTDTSITNRFDDIHSMYHGRVESSIGLLNTIKKYEDDEDSNVVIKYPKATEIREYVADYNEGRSEENKTTEARYLKQIIEDEIKTYGITFRYEDKYNVTVEESTSGEIVINYTRINK